MSALPTLPPSVPSVLSQAVKAQASLGQCSEDDLETPTLAPPAPQCWGPKFYFVLGTEPVALLVLGKPSAH